MERKTKKMVETEAEIVQKRAEAKELSGMITALDNYKPDTQNGQDARTQAITEITSRRDTINGDTRKLNEQLEVLTVDMLAGLDTDMADPTPAEALEKAS